MEDILYLIYPQFNKSEKSGLEFCCFSFLGHIYVTMVVFNISLSSFLFLLGIASLIRLITNGAFFTKTPYSIQFMLPQFTPFTKNTLISTINLDSYDTALLSIISSNTLTMSLSLFSNFFKHQDFSVRADVEIIRGSLVYRRCVSGSITTLSKISCKFSALDHSNINSIKSSSLKANVILTPIESTSTRLSILESMSASLVVSREQTRLMHFLNFLNIPLCASLVFTLFCLSCLVWCADKVCPQTKRMNKYTVPAFAGVFETYSY